MSTSVYAQISYLHKKFLGREWSGPIFYKVNGSLEDIDNLELRIEHFFLYDIGSAGYTEYDFDSEIIDFYNDHPECDPCNEEAEEWKIGHLHSHHNMAAFFSGTDSQELIDSAEQHNFFLSIIVNARDEMTARFVYKASIEQTVGFYTALKNYVTRKTQSEEVIGYHECDITFDVGDLVTRITKISERKLQEERAKGPVGFQNGNHSYDDRKWKQDASGRWFYDNPKSKKKERFTNPIVPRYQAQIPFTPGVLNVEGFCAKVLSANLNYMGSFHQALEEWKTNYSQIRTSPDTLLMNSLALVDHLTDHLTADQCDRLYREAATKFSKANYWFCDKIAAKLRDEFVLDDDKLERMSGKEFGTTNPSYHDDF